MRKTIREKIIDVLDRNLDREQTAIAICFALEDRLDLDGNGWWDDDPIMVAAFDERGRSFAAELDTMTPEERLALLRSF